MAGKPISSLQPAASSMTVRDAERGLSRPIFSIAVRKRWRFSALSMASALAPIISTPYWSSTPRALEVQGTVERGLAAHGRQQGVGAFALDDLGDHLRRDRFDIGGVGQLRVGHDRRRVGVDQDDPVALVLQRLARPAPRNSRIRRPGR